MKIYLNVLLSLSKKMKEVLLDFFHSIFERRQDIFRYKFILSWNFQCIYCHTSANLSNYS